MHHSRLVGGLAALAALLILCAAPAAGAASLTPVWSGDYTTSANDGFSAVATGPDGAVYAAGYAQGRTGRGQRAAPREVRGQRRDDERGVARAGRQRADVRGEVAVDPSGNVIVAGTQGPIELSGNGKRHRRAQGLAGRQGPLAHDLRRPAHRTDYVTDLALDANGNALVVGASTGKGTGRDYVTLKLRANGRAPGPPLRRPERFDEARGVAVDATGDVYVTGWSDDKDGTRRAIARISYSPAGARRWTARHHAAELEWRGRGHVQRRAGRERSRHLRVSGRPRDGRREPHVREVRCRGRQGHLEADRSPTASRPSRTRRPSTAPARRSPAGMSSTTDGIHGYIAGVSASGGDAWSSS